MKILVGVKRVVDYNVKVQLSRSEGGEFALNTDNLKMSMNPFDEIALEEALRLREKGAAAEIIAVSIGAESCQATLRDALAMGADRAILAETEIMPQPLDIARILARIAVAEQVSLVILGKQAIDDDSNQTGQMLAALLGRGQACFAASVEISGDEARIMQDTDSGTLELAVKLPAVITADLRLNEPRYATLPNIMKARKKPIERKSLADLGIELQPQTEIIELAPPPPRKPGVKLGSAAELAAKLRADKLL